MEDIGVRAVISGLGEFLTGMKQMQQVTTQESKELVSMTGAFARSTAEVKKSEVGTYKMRQAFSAVSNVFHLAASSMLFFMASNEKMSKSVKTATKILTGLSLAVALVTSGYRLYIAQAAIATAVTHALTWAMAASQGVALALGITVEAAIWPFTLMAMAIAALIFGIVLLVKYWDKVIAAFKGTSKETRALTKDIEQMKGKLYVLNAELAHENKMLEDHQNKLKRLQSEYDYVERNAAGYRDEIKRLNTAIESNKRRMDELKDSISLVNSELDDLAHPNIAGMQEYDDRIFDVQQQIKQLRLQELQYGESDALNQRIVDLEKQREELELQRDIKFDPLTRSATEAVETIKGLNDTIAPDEVMARIYNLGDQLRADTLELGSVQAETEALSTSLDRIMTIVTESLDAITEKMIAEKNSIYEMEDAISDTADEIAVLTQAINDLSNALKKAKGKTGFWDMIGDTLAGVTGALGLNGAQFGGYFPQTQRVRVGERGPEILTVPAGASVQPNQYNTTYNVDAHYTNPQQPQGIRIDLEYLRMRSRV